MGSLRTDTDSWNSFSPKRVPPPDFEKKERPSSAARADKLLPSEPRSPSTAAGSRMTV
jgi:hypothetical protein